MRSAWPVYVVLGMEAIGFGTGAFGESDIEPTERDEDIGKVVVVDAPVDELELESECDCTRGFIAAVDISVSVPVEVFTFPYLNSNSQISDHD